MCVDALFCDKEGITMIKKECTTSNYYVVIANHSEYERLATLWH